MEWSQKVVSSSAYFLFRYCMTKSSLLHVRGLRATKARILLVCPTETVRNLQWSWVYNEFCKWNENHRISDLHPYRGGTLCIRLRSALEHNFTQIHEVGLVKFPKCDVTRKGRLKWRLVLNTGIVQWQTCLLLSVKLFKCETKQLNALKRLNAVRRVAMEHFEDWKRVSTWL